MKIKLITISFLFLTQISQPATDKGLKSIAGFIQEDIQDFLNELNGTVDCSKYNITPTTRILLSGPPGTGKTALARAISEEYDIPFFHICASDFVDKYIGGTSKNLRNKFSEVKNAARASKSGKAFLFIDEIDAICSKSHKNILREPQAELLSLLDGFEKDDSVIVIGATNDPNGILPAFKRSGRFETIIKINLPDQAKRITLLEFYASKIPLLGSDINFNDMASRLEYCNAADIKNIVNIASRAAAKEQALVSNNHFNMAISRWLEMEANKSEDYRL